jgi:hypothetical protein
MSEHSPAPWWWTEDRTKLRAKNPWYEPNRYPPHIDYMNVLAIDEDYGDVPAPADAALIAAAPAMLDLLKRVAHYSDGTAGMDVWLTLCDDVDELLRELQP